MLQDPEDDGHGVGGVGGTDGDRSVQEADRKASSSEMRVRKVTKKNTLPLGGRVMGHARLYGEREGRRRRRPPRWS